MAPNENADVRGGAAENPELNQANNTSRNNSVQYQSTSDQRRKINRAALQGTPADVTDVEPWPESVNGADVLDQIAETLSRYIVLPDGAADAIALWCAYAHVFEAFVCSPRLIITSPDKRCGKTTLRDVLAELVPRPLPTENLTPAVMFRLIESHQPTILADEYDAWIRDNEELRGLLNAGYRRGSSAYRCQGDGHEVRRFNVFSPAVLCGIGSLPGTLSDRGITIRMKRAKRGEVAARFDSRHLEYERELQRKLKRFCDDCRVQLETCDPVLPAAAYNRVADNWRPLFAVTEVAGGDWPQGAVSAFAKLALNHDDEDSIATMMLADIRELLNEIDSERIFSRVLVESLCAMTDRPWLESNRGRPINERWLAFNLRGFGVRPKTLRIDDERAKGYERADFVEAFDRYLSESNMASDP